MSNLKPIVEIASVEAVLEQYMGDKVQDITEVTGGNLSAVYSFNHNGKGYVIHFSKMMDAFLLEDFIPELLSSQGVPYPRNYGQGKLNGLTYSISERINGILFADLTNEQRDNLLPDLVQVITRMNQIKLPPSKGFGWIKPNRDGMYPTWKEYLVTFYHEDQPIGNFWENWHDLFRTSFLEKDVFDECYARLMEFAQYNAPHRYFVHNDCHAWNILSDGRTITGIIDCNCLYGDFLIDISIAESTIPGRDVVQTFRDHYEQLEIPIPNFKERMLGARYYKGLDGLRFYAKVGRKQSYDELRNSLLA